MSIEELYQLYQSSPIICTDTRKIIPGSIFFSLKGDNFNGNSYAQSALDSGALYAVIDEAEFEKSDRYILVDNVLETLQDLARHHRQNLKITVIGITGSNGKTTTKELLSSVLSQKFKVRATEGNLNNHIGVPLTLLSVKPDIEIAIIEIGANHQKEIELLCSIAQPTSGLITNVGKAHLEGFGGFEGVKKGKGELYDYLQTSGGTTFVNFENSHLMQMSSQRNMDNLIYYGNSKPCFVIGYQVENNPYLTVEWFYENKTYRVKSNLTGNYNAENILAAIAIGLFYNLSAEQINNGIATYSPNNNRSQITKTEKNTLICDYYNANPSSMTAALDNFAGINAENKLIILGDMFELGAESKSEHSVIVKKASSIKADKVIFIGPSFYKHNTNQGLFFEDANKALDFLKENKPENATILIKGSRGMKLESLIEIL